MKTHLRTSMLVLLGALLTAGCSKDDEKGSTDTNPDETDGTLEIVSFWTNEADSQAMQVLIDSYKELVPGGEVTNLAEDWTTAFDIRAETLGKPNAPDIIQGFPRYLPNWLNFDGKKGNVIMEPLEDAIGEDSLAGYSPDILKMVSSGNHVYQLPASMHRLNAFYYNKRVLDQYKKEVPTTFAEFVTLATEMKEIGKPFAVSLPNHGAKEFFAWMAVQTQGAGWFKNLMHGKLDWDDDKIEEGLNEALDLAMDVLDISIYVGLEADRQDAEEALRQFRDGEISMFVYPDWMKAWLTSEGEKPGTDFGIMLPPIDSDDKIFTYIIDSFAVPKDAKHLDNALKFVEAASSPESIAELVRIKNSSSPRMDIETDKLDDVAVEALDELASAKVKNADETLASNAYFQIFVPDSAEAPLEDLAMLHFVQTYKDGDCEPEACKATFIEHFKSMWADVVAVAE